MATDITPQIRQALDESSGPLELVDRERNETFFVVRADLYEKLLATLDLAEPTPAERQALLQAWGKRAGWEDSQAAAFDDLKPPS